MRASDFIKDRPKGILTIFDIDDTLFHTTAKINVIKDGEVVRSLTNQEFNTYELQDGEEYDFGEFRNAEKFRQESEPIGPMLDELKTILDHTQGKVIMLTARADFDNKETFLQTFADHGIDMSKIHVHRAGNLPGKEGPAEKKAVWVRRYLDTGKFNQVSLYDDSMTNLRVFKELEQEYPDVTFDAYHITGNGDVKSLEERKKKKRKNKYGALYGPGPYGLYGWNTGYSGAAGVSSGEGGGDAGGDGGGMESRLNEAWTPDKKQRIKEFALWAIKLLEIQQAPRIKLVSDSGTSALGYFDPETQDIVVTVKDRHQMDIMRTLAHELVHRKQNEARELNGETGSPDENEANALAGVLLRWWGRKNPDQFNEHIVKVKGGYQLQSKKTGKNLGTYPTKSGAEKRERQVQYFKHAEEDQHPNERPRGPEVKPTMPAGTVRVDVSDVYDWYKLGQHISDLEGLGKHDFGKGPPSTIFSFGSEEEEHKYIKALQKTGLTTTDIDPVDPNQPKNMKKQKVDPTYNVGENFADGKNPQDKGDSKRHGISKGMSIAQLKKIRSSDSASPRKKQLAHWQINMRQGKKK
jgi:hypothetical protein